MKNLKCGPTLVLVFAAFALSATLNAQPSQAVREASNRRLAADLLRFPSLGEEPLDEYWDAAFYVYPEVRARVRPSPDAPLYQLAIYWGLEIWQDPEELPEALRYRLLEACEVHPAEAGWLARFVPRTPEAGKRLLAVLDRIPQHEPSRYALLTYFRRNSDAFRSELIAAATAVDERWGSIDGEEDLRALAKLDWESAKPVLARLADRREQVLKTLAVALQYQHAAGSFTPELAALHERLIKIATDSNATFKARELAIRALMEADWPGRDEWFLSLLRDTRLSGTASLEGPVHSDPSKWIPLISRFVGHSDPQLHAAAVNILVSFNGRESRPDAALPLLPWLFDPKWAPTLRHRRSELVGSLRHLNLHESIPGLLYLLQNPDYAHPFEIKDAAEAISKYNDKRSGPPLRELLNSKKKMKGRYLLALARALVASQTVSTEEKMQAVTALAVQLADPKARRRLRESRRRGGAPPDPQVVLGAAIVQKEGAQFGLAEALGQYRRDLASSDPAKSEALTRLLSILPEKERDSRLLTSIAEGTVEAAAVRDAIRRREWLVASSGADLRSIAKGKGTPAAVATILLDDPDRIIEILSGNDVVAQAALLAGMRLSGYIAPRELVRALLDTRDPDLAQAARSYWDLLERWQRNTDQTLHMRQY